MYGGKGAFTGPTVSGCSLSNGKLTVMFNTSLLKGDKVVLQKYVNTHVHSGVRVCV